MIDVYEELVEEICITILASNQYCVVENPYDENGKIRYGIKEMRKGENSFFLRPGEEISDGIHTIQVLQEDEAVMLKAREEYECPITKMKYTPGQRWMIRGPINLPPALEYEIIENRKAIPLSENEGIYVRDLNTGEVTLIRGPMTFLLG
mmetsp:Transcript_371/g.415  ORF Transcript_371/g.415 Transcript_371/m.415 type:complete len:150 (+) Transcript_371:860-1309(+)